jgi:taurine dioxygenase
MSIEFRPLAYALGAGATGVDASKPLSQDDIAQIRRAWLEYQVLVFPDQQVDMAQHIAFSRCFGDLELHPFMHIRDVTHPEIYPASPGLRDRLRDRSNKQTTRGIHENEQ